MHLARVTGVVVSTQKSPSLVGKKLLLVRRVTADGELPQSPTAGDESQLTPWVPVPVSWFYSAAAPAPGTFFTGPNEAIDLAIVGIVDTLSR